jgi:hypothetical protein
MRPVNNRGGQAVVPQLPCGVGLLMLPYFVPRISGASSRGSIDPPPLFRTCSRGGEGTERKGPRRFGLAILDRCLHGTRLGADHVGAGDHRALILYRSSVSLRTEGTQHAICDLIRRRIPGMWWEVPVRDRRQTEASLMLCCSMTAGMPEGPASVSILLSVSSPRLQPSGGRGDSA